MYIAGDVLRKARRKVKRRKVSDAEIRDIGRIRIYNDTDYKAAYPKVIFTKLGVFACPKLIAELDSM